MEMRQFPTKGVTCGAHNALTEKVFEDPLAMVLYLQYCQNHIVFKKMEDFLAELCCGLADEIRKAREVLSIELTLEQVVEMWERKWRYAPIQMVDDTREKWAKMIESLMDFVNGKRVTKLVMENSELCFVSEPVN